MAIFRSLTAWTLCLILVSCASGYPCNTSIFCKSGSSLALHLDGDSDALEMTLYDKRCETVRSVTAQVSGLCSAGSVECACHWQNENNDELEDKLEASVFVCRHRIQTRGNMWKDRGPVYVLKPGRAPLLPSCPDEANGILAKKHRKLDWPWEEEDASCLQVDNALRSESSRPVLFALYRDFWPVATDDVAHTLTDKAVSMNVLENDYISFGSPTLLELTQAPRQGFARIYGCVLMYTPFKGFFGTDRMSYKMEDSLHRIAIGKVEVFVKERHPKLTIPHNERPSSNRRDRQMLVTKADTLSHIEVVPAADATSPSPTPVVSNSSAPSPTSADIPSSAPAQSSVIVNGTAFPVLTPSANAPPSPDQPFDSTADSDLKPTIIAPQNISIVNVSVYLTGVAIHGISVQPSAASSASPVVGGFEVVLQVDSGALMVTLPRKLENDTKHQDTVGDFWASLPPQRNLTYAYVEVPGAGIQFLGTISEVNAALASLEFGKGFGVGKDSVSTMIMLVYPTNASDRSAITAARATAMITFKIEGAGAWFAFFHFTKTFYNSSVTILSTAMIYMILLCCALGVCVCRQNRLQRRFDKMHAFVKVENAAYDETRVFNPVWIPSAPVEQGREIFVITPNPKFLQQRQAEHIIKLHGGGLEKLEKMIDRMNATASEGDPSEGHLDSIYSSTRTSSSGVASGSVSPRSPSSTATGESTDSHSTHYSIRENRGQSSSSPASPSSRSEDSQSTHYDIGSPRSSTDESEDDSAR